VTRPLLIGIAGGTGSGKSTVARKIADGLPADSVAVIDHDSYYRDRSDLTYEARTTLNYDHPDALDIRNPALVLIWVQEQDEPEIRKVFEQTLSVRELSPQAKALADRFFFETLVRLHRAGEGAPFTGLKPAGRDLGPAIPAADEAIRVGSVDPIRNLLTVAIEERLGQEFRQVIAAKTFKPDDVAAGRAYIKAYVEFIHFAERLYDNTMKAPQGHFEEK